MKFNISKFIPKILDNRDVFVECKDNNVFIKCNKIRPPRPIELKFYIDINSSFMEIIGLYFGDGNNKPSGSAGRRVALANSCPYLHKIWIDFLEKFNIDRTKLNVQTQIGFNNSKFDEDILSYWSCKLDLPLSCFTRKVSIKKCNSTYWGLAVVNFNNKIFRKIFDNIFNCCLNLCKNDEELSKGFLRGLFAAEGHVNLNSYKTLNALNIPVKDDQRRIFVKSLLDNLEIKSRDCYGRLDITGYLNFKIVGDISLCDLHPDKKSVFEKGYTNLLESHATKSLTKLKILNLLEKENLTRFDISNKLERGVSAIHKSLKDLENKGFVKRLGKSHSLDNRKLRDIWSLISIPKDLSILMIRDY